MLECSEQIKYERCPYSNGALHPEIGQKNCGGEFFDGSEEHDERSQEQSNTSEGTANMSSIDVITDA